MKRVNVIFLLSLIMIICHLQCAFAHETLPSGVPVNKVCEKADAIINKHIGKDLCGASLVVINDGKVIFEKGYGYSDREKKIPVDPHKTVFEYGSISRVC